MDHAFHLRATLIHLHLRPSSFLCSGECTASWLFDPPPKPLRIRPASAVQPRTTATQPFLRISALHLESDFYFSRKQSQMEDSHPGPLFFQGCLPRALHTWQKKSCLHFSEIDRNLEVIKMAQPSRDSSKWRE